MQEQRCFLIGHRETSERVYPVLEKTVRALAEKGVKEFFVGSMVPLMHWLPML